MADNDTPTLRVVLDTLLNSKGFDEFQKRAADVVKTGNQLKDTGDGLTSAFKGFGDQFEQLGSRLVSGLAIYALVRESIEGIKSAVTAAVAEQSALQEFDAVNKELFKSTTENTAANREWLDSVSQASGKTKAELVPAYNTLAAISKDSAEAQVLLQTALGLAARGFGTAEENVTSLARSMQSGAATGRGDFRRMLQESIDKAGSFEGGLRDLITRFGDAGAAVDTLAMRQGRLKASMEDAKAAIGEGAAVLMTHLAPALEKVMMLFGMIYGGIQSFIIGAGRFFTTLGEIVGGVIDKVTFGHTHINAAMRSMSDSLAELQKSNSESTTRMLEGIDSAFHKTTDQLVTGTKTGANAAKEAAEASAKAVQTALMETYKQEIADARNSGKTQIEVLTDVRNIYQTMEHDKRLSVSQRTAAETEAAGLTKRLAVETEAAEKKARQEAFLDAKAHLEAEELTEQQYHKAYLKLLEDRMIHEKLAGREYDELMKEMKQARDTVLKDNLESDKKEEEAETKSIELRLKTLIAYFQKIKGLRSTDYTAEIQAIQTILKTEKMSAEERTKLEAQLQQLKIQNSQAMIAQDQKAADEALGVAAEAFGQSKGIAIAQVVVNTAAAVAKIWGQTGIYAVIAEVAAIAMGAAQIAKIESATPSGGKGGKGFDDPVNDYAAALGGERWAVDFTKNFAGGMASAFGRMQGGPAHNTTTRYGDNNHNVAIHLRGLMHVDPNSSASIRKLYRGIQKVATLDNRRTIGATAVRRYGGLA